MRVRPGPDGALCPRCGGRGCLETLSPERAVLAQLEEVLRNTDGSPMDIRELLKSPHPAVQEALWEAGWWTGVAIAHACVMLNPTQVILGGALVEDPRFRSHVWQAIDRNAMAEIRAAGEERYMPTWKQLTVDNAGLNLPQNLTPELLGALALVVDELADDYLRDPITSWYRDARKRYPFR